MMVSLNPDNASLIPFKYLQTITVKRNTPMSHTHHKNHPPLFSETIDCRSTTLQCCIHLALQHSSQELFSTSGWRDCAWVFLDYCSFLTWLCWLSCWLLSLCSCSLCLLSANIDLFVNLLRKLCRSRSFVVIPSFWLCCFRFFIILII